MGKPGPLPAGQSITASADPLEWMCMFHPQAVSSISPVKGQNKVTALLFKLLIVFLIEDTLIIILICVRHLLNYTKYVNLIHC